MRKAAPQNVERGDGRDPPYPIEHDPAEVRGWNWGGGPLRTLLAAFLALMLVGVVLLGIEREAAEIDFQLLVTALRATPAASLAAALAATALSYLALIGYDVCSPPSAASPSETPLAWVPSQAGPYVIDCIQLQGSRRAKLRA
jgi:hypothetical protein